MKSPGGATVTIRSQPMTLRGNEKKKRQESKAYKINKQMHEKHIDQLSFSQAR